MRQGTKFDRLAITTTDGMMTALARQDGLRVSAPAGVTVDAFSGTYIERRVPPKTDLFECDGAEFRVYLASQFENRYLKPGQHRRRRGSTAAGVPIVFDASVYSGTSPHVQAELRQMVESIQIDPR